MSNSRIKVYLYTRVSTLMQIDGYSLDAQYNVSDNLDKSFYDVRSSEPYQGGTEPLMQVRIMDKK